MICVCFTCCDNIFTFCFFANVHWTFPSFVQINAHENQSTMWVDYPFREGLQLYIYNCVNCSQLDFDRNLVGSKSLSAKTVENKK